MEADATRNDRILDAWAKGDSASQIMGDLKLQSRCVVLGVVSRARKAGDARAELRGDVQFRIACAVGARARAKIENQPRKKHFKIFTASKPILRLVENFDATAVGPMAATIHFIKKNRCRFPVRGSGASMLMCGEPVSSPTHSYCPGHCAVAYRASKLVGEAD